jgi:hypothetical protein
MPPAAPAVDMCANLGGNAGANSNFSTTWLQKLLETSLRRTEMYCAPRDSVITSGRPHRRYGVRPGEEHALCKRL